MTTTHADGRSRAANERMQALQQSVIDLILDHGLRPGAAMPTEAELTQELDVSRNTLREAMKALQSRGILEVRHGYGTFVAHKNLDALAMGLEFHALLSLQGKGQEALEIIDVRQALESGLIASVVEVVTKEELDDLERCVRGMETEADEGRMSPDLDQEFHRLLFKPLGNDLLGNLLDVFWSVYSRIRHQLDFAPEEATENARVHREIYETVRSGQPEQATELLRRHFDGLRGAIQRGR